VISSPRTAKTSGLARARLRGLGVSVALGFAVSAGCSESTRFTEGEEEYICYGGTTAAPKGGQASQGTGGAMSSGGTTGADGGASVVETGGAAGASGGSPMSDAGAGGFDAGGQAGGEAGGGGNNASGGRASGGGGGKGGAGGASGGTGGGTAGNGHGGSGPQCGDKTVQAPEECDDGNKKSGDGCSSTCTKSCETCELGSTDANMMFAVEECYRNVSIMAVGAGAGVPKNELCTAFMDCARRTRCFEATDAASDTPLNLVNCYCKNTDLYECAAMGPDAPEAVKKKFIPGDCQLEMEELLGTNLGARIVTEKDQSAAASLFFADWDLCSKDCKVADGDCRRLIDFTIQLPPSLTPDAPPRPGANGKLDLSVSVLDLNERPVATKWSVTGGGTLTPTSGIATSYTCPQPAPATAPQVVVEASVGTCVSRKTVVVDCAP